MGDPFEKVYIEHSMGGYLLKIPDAVEEAIVTPHDHETDRNRPVWLIFLDRGDGDGWWLNCVCDSEESARYHYRSALPQSPSREDDSRAYVERVPLNHAFGSSLKQIFWEEELKRRRDFRKSQGQYGGHPHYKGYYGD